MHLSVARSLPWLAALSAVAACVSGVRPSSNATPLRDARTALRQTVDSLVDVPEFRNAHWGILIVDPGRGETLYSRNADKLFMPASNQKLLTGATALALLGPDFRWPTTFLASGPVRSGVLEGDLMVRGSGDPSVSAHAYRGDALAPLRSVADSLRAHGITRIRGRIVAAPSPFTDAPLGYGWSWSELDEPYSAGVDALVFNEGFSEIVVRGGARPGEPVTAVTRPLGAHPPLVVRAATVARAPAGAAPADSMAALPAIKVERDSARGAIVVNGTLAVGDSTALAVAYRDQPGAYLAALGEALRASGVSIEQARTDTTARLDSVATIMSLPLRDVLPLFEKPSQNQIGELLFKTLAVVKTGVGTADSAAQVVARQLVAWGVPPEGFAVRDGSGLSRHDYVSPRTLVRVLDVMRQSPDFKIFYDALPIAGVDGTTRNRMKGTAAAGNIHAKTGTLDKARSLSGYVTTADGRLLLFSILCNNYTVPTRRVDQVTDALGIRLATLQLRAE